MEETFPPFSRAGKVNANCAPIRPQIDDCIVTNVADITDDHIDTTPVDAQSGDSARVDGEGVCEGDEVHEEYGARARKPPYVPTTAERDHHESTGHAVFRS